MRTSIWRGTRSLGGVTLRSSGYALLTLVTIGVVPVIAVGQDAPKGDVFDQFYRFTNPENHPFHSEQPGETIDPFTGTLRIVEEDVITARQGRAESERRPFL